MQENKSKQRKKKIFLPKILRESVCSKSRLMSFRSLTLPPASCEVMDKLCFLFASVSLSINCDSNGIDLYKIYVKVK